MSPVINYLKEVSRELMQVTWPKRADVVRLTVVILGVSGIFGVFIGLLDFSFTKLLSFLVSS